ncbi:MAG: hypothetical protein ACTSR8_09905 [Promethearchaeota archaeon]
MDPQEFVQKLTEVQDLMKAEKYKDAIIILNNLKEIEKQGDFDYNLTHKLYQLISNTHSLYNQEIILNVINNLQDNTIDFDKLLKLVNTYDDIDLKKEILRREIELLILRGKLNLKLEQDRLILHD